MAVLNRKVNADGSGTGLWTDAPVTIDRNVVFMDIIGPEGSGRTTLALTAPGPIAYLHAAEKKDGIIEPFARIKKIREFNFGGVFRGSTADASKAANAVWVNYMACFSDAFNWAKTIIVDTNTEAWELLRLARFGELNPKGRTEALYGPVNAEWRSQYKQFRKQNRTNVITIHQVKDKYVDKMVNSKLQSVNTGTTIRAGQKEIGYLADVVVRTGRGPNREFLATIEKGWYNAGGTEGIELENELVTFPYIMNLITDKGEEVWS